MSRLEKLCMEFDDKLGCEEVSRAGISRSGSEGSDDKRLGMLRLELGVELYRGLVTAWRMYTGVEWCRKLTGVV